MIAPTRRRFTALSLAAGLAAPGLALAQPRSALVVATGADDGALAHTRSAYEAAVNAGADFLEFGVVATRDGALAAWPDHELSATTDVASRAEFAERGRTKVIDGQARHGWFSEDFTLTELKTLSPGAPTDRGRARLAAKGVAPPTIPTVREAIDIARAGSIRTGRVVGVYFSLVRPGWFASQDMALEARLAALIRAAGYNSPVAAMFVASSEAAALKTLAGLARVRRVQRVTGDGLPDLAEAHAYAQALVVGPAQVLSAGRGPAPAGQVAAAHAAGLAVHVQAPGGGGSAMLKALLAADIDAILIDSTRDGVRARRDAGRSAP